MKDAPVDEPIHGRDEEVEADGTLASDDVEQPGIVASVGSGALGSADIEPQAERHPDNDGETVEDE